LRAFIRWANGLSKKWTIEPLTQNNPFDRYSIVTEQYGTPFYLTIEERNTLAAAELPPRLAIQRDIFVFQCLIGCRVSDLWAMTNASIINDAVEYIPRKTKEGRPITVRVPLNKQAKALVDKYKDNGDTRLFPFTAQQQYNEDIKEMLTLAGITRLVTILDPTTRQEVKRPINEVASSHMARRTFIGNLYKKVKDPNLVGKLSGHKENSRAFARYSDIDDDMAKELVDMLE
jgi:integrase